MEFFRKKHCDVCGEKISLLGNKKLKDGNMCKNCEKLLSPYFDGRRKTNLSDIKDHLAYREENKKNVALFNPTRSIGSYKRVILDDFSEKFIVTSSNNWQNENPDIIDISQVRNCHTEIRQNKTELMRKDANGKEISYSPARYDINIDFLVTIQVDSPWFDRIFFTLNDMIIHKVYSKDYWEMVRQSEEIKEALTSKILMT